MAANPESLRISVMPSVPATAVAPARVTYAAGDGIGPEIMDAVLRILEAAGASLQLDEIRVGRAVYEAGVTSGIPGAGLGSAPAQSGVPQGADHHAPGQRLQEPERHAAQDARSLRQRAALRQLRPRGALAAPRHGHRDRARERGGHLRGHRAPSHRRGRAVPEAGLRSGQRARGALRLRVCARQRTQQGHLPDQGQHHEAHRRPVPPGLRAGGARIPGHRVDAPDHRHRHGPGGRKAAALRRHRHAQPVRGHPVGRRRRGLGIGGHGAVGEHRQGLRHVRGGPRLRAGHRRARPCEPIGPAACSRHDARPPRAARGRGADPQRLAARARTRAAHRRHLPRRLQPPPGRHARVRDGRHGRTRCAAEDADPRPVQRPQRHAGSAWPRPARPCGP